MNENKPRIFYVCAILEKDNKILLLKRTNTGWMDGNWCIPGGSVEENETFLETAIREMKEELDLTFAPDQLSIAHILEMHTKDSKRIGVYFSSNEWQGEAKNNEPHEHGEMAWFSIDALPENMIQSGKHVIEQYKKNKNISIIIQE